MTKTIPIACQGALSVDYQALTPFQGGLKTLSEENYTRMRKEILDLGFSEPIAAWQDPEGRFFILNGHQRLTTVKRMVETEGYAPCVLPVSTVKADSYAQAKRKVLALASTYGAMTEASLAEFMIENEISMEELSLSFDFPTINLDTLGDLIEDHDHPGGHGCDEGDDYTKKIKAPIYIPTGELPSIKSLVDTSKFQELNALISSAGLPEELRMFLVIAAARHNVFDYEKIAEYYAHATREVQDLMERSALVIIDFNKAIEGGFVVLSQAIAEGYKGGE